MSQRKRIAADLLFWVQMIGGFIFGAGQFIRMLQTTTGVNVSWFVSWEVFLLLNLWLAAEAHKAQPSRVTRQTLASYLLWIVLITANSAVVFFKDGGAWDEWDTTTTCLVGIGVTLTAVYGHHRKIGVKDPVVRGILACCFKAIPQLALAYKMSQVGGDGLFWLTVVNGHITVLTRLGQLVFSIKEAGWDRNRIGSAVSEVGNEISWMVATIVWIFT